MICFLCGVYIYPKYTGITKTGGGNPVLYFYLFFNIGDAIVDVEVEVDAGKDCNGYCVTVTSTVLGPPIDGCSSSHFGTVLIDCQRTWISTNHTRCLGCVFTSKLKPYFANTFPPALVPHVGQMDLMFILGVGGSIGFFLVMNRTTSSSYFYKIIIWCLC